MANGSRICTRSLYLRGRSNGEQKTLARGRYTNEPNTIQQWHNRMAAQGSCQHHGYRNDSGLGVWRAVHTQQTTYAGTLFNTRRGRGVQGGGGGLPPLSRPDVLSEGRRPHNGFCFRIHPSTALLPGRHMSTFNKKLAVHVDAHVDQNRRVAATVCRRTESRCAVLNGTAAAFLLFV